MNPTAQPRDLGSARVAGSFPGALCLIAAIVALYANTFSVPFVFDDLAAVTRNPSIEHISTAFAPPAGLSVTGRPVVNVSLALSHALCGRASWGYHAVNIVLHAAAALVLFGFVYRTLRRVRPAGEPARTLAFAVALLWAVHPLQTASVTYVMQRSEQLVSLCYLLTLYGFARATEWHPMDVTVPDRRGPLWQGFAFAACLCGMASKELMVTAPLAVLLYDRLLICGSFRAALRQRPLFYAALGSTWLVLAGLVLGTGNRNATAGFGAGVAWGSYALTQLHAVAHYLRLAVWPHPLVFDYGTSLVSDPALVVPAALLVAALAVATLLALRRWPVAGFCGACFFGLLAPSSSIVPVATQPIAEHRLYLALAAPLALAVVLLHRWFGNHILVAFLSLAAVFGVATVARNADYRTAVALWRDTTIKCPTNARAHYNLGVAELAAGARASAVAEFCEAIRLEPNHVLAHIELGSALLEAGQPAAALAELEIAVQLAPANAAAQDGLARVLAELNRLPEAIAHFERAAELRPESAAAHRNLANALAQLGRFRDALPHYLMSLRLEPGQAAVHHNLGHAFAEVGRIPEAIVQFEAAVRLAPENALARANLARLREYSKSLRP